MNVIGLVTVACSVFVLGLMLYIFFRRDSLYAKLRQRIGLLESRMREFNTRVIIVENQASDYMNSLGPEGSRLIAEIRDMVNSINYLLDEVGSLTATRDLGALQEAELLLEGRHPEQNEQVRNYDGTLSTRYTIPHDWEDRLESMLQTVGQEVSRASIKAKEAGIPKRPKRQSTIFSLFKAGIRTGKGPYEW